MDPFHNHKYHQLDSGSMIGFSAVEVVLVYPVFETHFRYFAREMMRLTGSNSLVWMTAYRNKWVRNYFKTTWGFFAFLLSICIGFMITDIALRTDNPWGIKGLERQTQTVGRGRGSSCVFGTKFGNFLFLC